MIGIPEKEDGSFSDHEYFCINDDLFDRIKSTHQDQTFLWNFLFNELNEDESQSEATETHNDKIQNKKRTAKKYSTKHNLQRKRKKPFGYRKDSFDDFRLMIVDPHQKLDSGVVPDPDGTIYLVNINETHYWGSFCGTCIEVKNTFLKKLKHTNTCRRKR